MTVKSVPFFRMNFTNREINAVNAVMKNGWLTTGNVSKELEWRFSAYVNCKYAAAVGSCTGGLLLALKALNIGKGDKVITTPYTFVATAEAIIHAGATPIFADIDPHTLNIDPASVADKINSKVKAILPVHIAGLPCRMDQLARIALKHKLHIVHDAAHAIGASFQKKKIGAIADISSFSFYATKNLTTGEGGMVTTNSKKLADKVQILSLHGMDKKAWRRYLDQGNWYYEVVDLGYKYNLADMNAALGLAMMDRLDKLQARRERVAGWYNRELSKYDEIEIPPVEQDSVHAWHLYIIKLNLDKLSIDRNQFIRELNSYNIGVGVHFIPLFLHPYYKGKYGLNKRIFPNAKEAFEKVISLPFFPDLHKAEVKYVADCIGKIIVKNQKL